jgi:hypothetical protein
MDICYYILYIKQYKEKIIIEYIYQNEFNPRKLSKHV